MQRTNHDSLILLLNINLLIPEGGIVNKIAEYISYHVNFYYFYY